MKVRNGFVTNSSSSSFVLAFKNDDRFKSYEEFRDQCNWLDYGEFYSLVQTLKEDPEHTDKNKALELLKNVYSFEYKFKLLDETFHECDYENISDYYKDRNKYAESNEFKEQVDTFLMTDEEYLEKKNEIESADQIVMGMIWDTSGGLLEWSIRNGFIEDNFSNNCVLVHNVG